MGHKDPYSTRRYAKMATEALKDLIEDVTVHPALSVNCPSANMDTKEVIEN